MPRIIITAFFGAGCSLGMAQINATDAQTNLNSLGSGGGMFRSFDNHPKGIQGSPLLSQNNLPGLIILSSGTLVRHNAVNYDLYMDELIVLKGGHEVAVGKEWVKGFMLFKDEDTLAFTKENVADNEIYVRKLTAGKNELLKKYGKEVLTVSRNDVYAAGKSDHEFSETTHYFLKVAKGDLIELKNKDQLLEALPDKKDQLTGYFKKNKPKFKKEEDLIRLVKFLNSIES